MKYYSTHRPLSPGAHPRQGGTEMITNFDSPIYCEKIGQEAWRYVEYEQEEANHWELTPEGVLWFPVTVSSRKRSGGLRVSLGRPKRSQPDDTNSETAEVQWKILTFRDEIVLPKRGTDPEGYYGEDIGDWRSSKPDSTFALGLIWQPFDHIYHYSEMVCRNLVVELKE